MADALYFVDEIHQQNYIRLMFLFLGNRRDTEYQTACYVLALPEIYQRVKWSECERPFDFVRWRGARAVDLSHGYDQLVKMARNLFNANNSFNLMEALSVWDQKCFRVFQQAMAIRKDRFT